MKKAMCIILASLLIFGMVGCGKSDESVGSNAKIYGMLSTEKYMLDKAIDSEENTTLNFAGIRNEIQSAQLTFTAKVKITSFNLITADLKEDGGEATISKDLFDVYAERYIEIYNPFISDASYLSDAGYYPDALVPIDRDKKRGEDRVEKGNNQAIWIDVNIPADAKAGT